MFAKLGQHAASRLRVEEGDVELLGTLARSLVDEADALAVALCQSIGHTVLNAESHVVHTLVALVEPLLDGALGRCRLKQFELCLAALQEGCLHLLVFYYFYYISNFFKQ